MNQPKLIAERASSAPSWPAARERARSEWDSEALLAGYLRGAGALWVLAGAALHASGMRDKHRIVRPYT